MSRIHCPLPSLVRVGLDRSKPKTCAPGTCFPEEVRAICHVVPWAIERLATLNCTNGVAPEAAPP